MNKITKLLGLSLILACICGQLLAQKTFESYAEAKLDSISIGTGEGDFLPYIQKGYTLALPNKGDVRGTLIFLEGSMFDKKNKSAKQVYRHANKKGFAVMSVSTEIPLDFYFTDDSSQVAHNIIAEVFKKHQLPNKNIFMVGVGLSGHRAMKYVAYLKKSSPAFMPNIKGMVICDSALDWVRQYNEGARDVRINVSKGSVWEGSLTMHLLSEHLNGTPKTNLESYLEFSSYSYSDEKSRHIDLYKDLAVRTYMHVAIQYWLEEKRKTPFDNNGADMVGLIAELKLAGNEKSDLVIIYPDDSKAEKKNVDNTWASADKKELMKWVVKQVG